MFNIKKSFSNNYKFNKYTEDNNMNEYVHNNKYFFDKEITSEEFEVGYINYRTLASAFYHILCNDITKLFYASINGECEIPELVNGSDYDEEKDEWNDIYQYYIISDHGYEILSEYTDEIIYYLPSLDIYIWGVTHFGTPWDGIFTNIKIELKEAN